MPAGVVVGMDAVGRDFVGAVEILSVDEMEVLVFGHAFRAEVMEQPLHFKLPGFQFGPQPALDMARGGDEDDLRVGHFRADVIQEGGHVLADDVRPHVVHGIDDEHFHALQFGKQFGDFHVEAAAAGEAEIHERHIQVARKDLRDAEARTGGIRSMDDAGAVIDEFVVFSRRQQFEGGARLKADPDLQKLVAHRQIQTATAVRFRNAFQNRVFRMAVLDALVVGVGARPPPTDGVVVVHVEIDAGECADVELRFADMVGGVFHLDAERGGICVEETADAAGRVHLAGDMREMVHCFGEAVERRFALHVTPAEAFEIRGGEFVVGDFWIAHVFWGDFYWDFWDDWDF